MKIINKMNLDKGTSIQQQESAGKLCKSTIIYVNYANSENCNYDTLRDGGWTNNDYQNLQG